VAVELALLTPLLMLFGLLAVGLGRLGSARLEVDSAARQAARAASIARDPDTAAREARTAAVQTLTGGRLTCAELTVAVDLYRFQPGGMVRVRVACTVRLTDVTMSGLPGSHTVTSTSVSVVDVHRGDLR
jgi:Flp pilus assembly protein TadG